MTLRFSVITPVYRQWDVTPKLLACLRAQTFPAGDFETILVDNEPIARPPPPSPNRPVPAAWRLIAHPARVTWVKLSQQKPGGRIASGSQCLRLIWLLRTATPRAGLSRHAPVAKAMDYMLKLGPASARRRQGAELRTFLIHPDIDVIDWNAWSDETLLDDRHGSRSRLPELGRGPAAAAPRAALPPSLRKGARGPMPPVSRESGRGRASAPDEAEGRSPGRSAASRLTTRLGDSSGVSPLGSRPRPARRPRGPELWRLRGPARGQRPRRAATQHRPASPARPGRAHPAVRDAGFLCRAQRRRGGGAGTPHCLHRCRLSTCRGLARRFHRGGGGGGRAAARRTGADDDRAGDPQPLGGLRSDPRHPPGPLRAARLRRHRQSRGSGCDLRPNSAPSTPTGCRGATPRSAAG